MPSTTEQQLISKITCCGCCFTMNKHILNPQCHMSAHPYSKKQPLWSMQPYNHVDASVFVRDSFIHPLWALTATSSCLSAALNSTPDPLSADTDKVAAALLSQRLKSIYKFCQAVVSVTLLLLADVKSCFNANPEQALQCTTLPPALCAHQLCRRDLTVGMRSLVEGGQEPSTAQFPALPSQSSAAESWL